MFLFLASWLTLASGLIKKQATLNSKNSSLNGASITINPQSTIIADAEYNIHVHFQDSYDLKLSLDDSWGFESPTISTFTLTLYGSTPFPNYDTDVIIVFSVGDLQYLSFFLHLDTNNINSRIYPSVSMEKNREKVSEWISDINTIRQRWYRVSNDDQWISLNQWYQQSLWPLTFVITNNPKEQYSLFEFYHNTSSFAVGYTFDASFVPDQTIDVYIMGQSTFETFSISSFNILLTNDSTSFPTIEPTPEPTDITHNPTLTPTFTSVNSLTKFANVSQTIPHTNTKQSQASLKSQAVIIVVVILICVIVFLCAVMGILRFSKPVNNERKASFDHDEDDETDDDETHTESNSTQNEYLNEGPLSATIYNMRYIKSKKDTDIDESTQFSSQSVTETIHTSISSENTMSQKSDDSVGKFCMSF